MSKKAVVRRTQQQRKEETIKALLAAGRLHFGDSGYEKTLINDIAASAGVTKGALYHHFPEGKPALFEAVVLEAQRDMVSAMVAAANSSSTKDTLRSVLEAYFDVGLDNRVYSITLQDAPAVFGVNRWREIEHDHALKFIQAGMQQYMTDLGVTGYPLEMLSVAIFGACCEATISISAANDASVAREEAISVIMAMIEGVRLAATDTRPN